MASKRGVVSDPCSVLVGRVITDKLETQHDHVTVYDNMTSN